MHTAFIALREFGPIVLLSLGLAQGVATGAHATEARDEMQARIMKDLDANGDGVVSIEERHEARERFKLKRFDKDCDGKLNEKEEAAFAKRRAERLGEYDVDGDGQLSADERKAMRTDRQKRRTDADGDGVISEQELAAARERHQALRGEMGENAKPKGEPAK